MRKHAETFHTNNGKKLVIVVSKPASPFSNYNLRHTFQMLFRQKRSLAHPHFLYEKESLQHCLSYDMRQTVTF